MDHDQKILENVIVISLPKSEYLSHAVGRVTEMLIPRHPANRYVAEFQVDLSHEDGHCEIIITSVSDLAFSAFSDRIELDLGVLVSSLEKRSNKKDREAIRLLRKATMNGALLSLPPQSSPQRAISLKNTALECITCTARFEFTSARVRVLIPHSATARFEVAVDGWQAEGEYSAAGKATLQPVGVSAAELKALFDAVEVEISRHFRHLCEDFERTESLIEQMEAEGNGDVLGGGSVF